jgi:Tfp pilus assembly protein PilO
MSPVCPEHSGVDKRLDSVETTLKNIPAAFDAVYGRIWKVLGLIIGVIVVLALAGAGYTAHVAEGKVSRSEFDTLKTEETELQKAYQDTRGAVINIEASLREIRNKLNIPPLNQSDRGTK